ncbi:unnamed protein product [Calypogeia fissa]
MKKQKSSSHRPEFHRFELAWIVRNYLEEYHFTETFEKFKKEAGEALKHPKGKEVSPQDVKSLRQVLEDYVAAKTALEDRTRDLNLAKEKTQTLVKSFNKAISEFYTAAPSSQLPNLPSPILPSILQTQQPVLREGNGGNGGNEDSVKDLRVKKTQKRRRKESSSNLTHLEDSSGKTPCPNTPPQQTPSAQQDAHPPVQNYDEDRRSSYHQQGEACDSSCAPSSPNSSPSAGTRGTSLTRPMDVESPVINLSDFEDMVDLTSDTSEDKVNHNVTSFCPPDLLELDEILGVGLDSEELMNFVMS